MPATITIIVAVILIGGGLMAYMVTRKREIAPDLGALMTAQGWRMTGLDETMTGGGMVTVSDPADDWTLSIATNEKTRSKTDRQIIWHSPSCALPSGAAAIGPALTQQMREMLDRPMPDMVKGMFDQMMEGVVSEIGPLPDGIAVVATSRTDPRGILMATPGRETALNALRDHPGLAQARANHDAQEVPVILRDATGLTLRVGGAIKSHDRLTDLVRLGRSLRDVLQQARDETP